MKILNQFRKLLIGKQVLSDQKRIKNELRYNSLVDKIARYLACEMIEGDYCEFGVFRGASFISSYQALHRHFKMRIEQEEGSSLENNTKRKQIIDDMRFFAFDSFEGLPPVVGADEGGDFAAGQYAFSEEDFIGKLKVESVSDVKLKTVKGWFEDTCTPGKFESLGLKKIAFAWIDCDLYESTVPILKHITPLLSPGAVLVFDDWYSYKGSPFSGEQRAFYEWLEENPNIVTTEYHKDSWKRNSFIINSRT